MNYKNIIGGAVGGFIAAFVIDLNAWSKSTDSDGEQTKFSWKLAIKRWVAGAVSGALGASGIGAFDF